MLHENLYQWLIAKLFQEWNVPPSSEVTIQGQQLIKNGVYLRQLGKTVSVLTNI